MAIAKHSEASETIERDRSGSVIGTLLLSGKVVLSDAGGGIPEPARHDSDEFARNQAPNQ
jgi:hypothetical protein